MWQFAEAVAGLGEACRALGTPITGGNVSLYNETDGTGILPTPVLAVVGLLEDASKVLTRVFPEAGLEIVLLGDNAGELGGSEYLKTVHGLVRGVPPRLDLERERALQQLLVTLANDDAIRSAHDCSEGGFAVTLAECCFDSGGVGAVVSVPAAASDAGVDLVLATLFGESPSRVVASVEPGKVDAVMAAAAAAGVPAARIGRTGGDRIVIDVDGARAIDCALDEAEARWRTSLQGWLDGRAA
jgi:phosphoribosylformylglycinamidine synthase